MKTIFMSLKPNTYESMSKSTHFITDSFEFERKQDLLDQKFKKLRAVKLLLSFEREKRRNPGIKAEDFIENNSHLL